MAGVGDASGIVVAKGYGGEISLEPSMSTCGIAMGRAIATTIYNQDGSSSPSAATPVSFLVIMLQGPCDTSS